MAASLRGAPAIAFGDVVGANVAICTVALGVAAMLAPAPFGRRVRRYALGAPPAGAVMAAMAWDGRVGRAEAAVLVALYVAHVAAIWAAERRPPHWARSGRWTRSAKAAGSAGTCYWS